MKPKVIAEVLPDRETGCMFPIYNKIRFIRINECVAEIQLYYAEFDTPEKWNGISRFNIKSRSAKNYEQLFNIKFNTTEGE